MNRTPPKMVASTATNTKTAASVRGTPDRRSIAPTSGSRMYEMIAAQRKGWTMSPARQISKRLTAAMLTTTARLVVGLHRDFMAIAIIGPVVWPAASVRGRRTQSAAAQSAQAAARSQTRAVSGRINLRKGRNDHLDFPTFALLRFTCDRAADAGTCRLEPEGW